MDLPLRVSAAQEGEADFGPLTVLFRRRASGVDYAVCRRDTEQERTDGPRPDVLWRRYVGDSSSEVLQLSLALPDLPVVVTPDVPVYVAAGAEVELFALIPGVLALSFLAPDHTQVLPPLEEIPIIELGRTWLGSAAEGRLCYSLSSSLEESAPRPLPEEWDGRIVSPLRIRNTAGAAARIQKLVVLSPQLSLLQESDGTLTTNATLNVLQKDGEMSFALGRERLKDKAGRRVLGRPRNPDEDSWWKRGIDLIQRISSYN
ncbi:MAG: hypothetical protein ACOCW6_02150 [Spirochaetota bacterium]